MRDQGCEVNCQRFVLDLTEELPNVGNRAAAVAGDQRSHAHADEVLSSGKTINRLDVSVHIDETGRDDLSFSIDNVGGGARIDSANKGNVAIPNADIGSVPGIATAVYDASVCYHDIVTHRNRFVCRASG